MSHPDEQLRSLLNKVSDGVYFLDRERRITWWNDAADCLTGYRAEEVIGSRCSDGILMHVDESGRQLCGVACPMQAAMEDGVERDARVYLHHRLGHRVPVHVRVQPVRDAAGAITGAVELFAESSSLLEMRRRMEELRRMALVDPLTGVGNRRLADKTLQARRDEQRRYGWRFGLLMADIDRFKRINDEHGHETGDAVLAMVARTLSHAVRTSDVVTRWGGEEFLVVLANADHAVLALVADRVRALVAASSLPGRAGPLRVTVSVGATLARPDEAVEEALRRADGLLYAAKQAGRDRVHTEDALTPVKLP